LIYSSYFERDACMSESRFKLFESEYFNYREEFKSILEESASSISDAERVGYVSISNLYSSLSRSLFEMSYDEDEGGDRVFRCKPDTPAIFRNSMWMNKRVEKLSDYPQFLTFTCVDFCNNKIPLDKLIPEHLIEDQPDGSIWGYIKLDGKTFGVPVECIAREYVYIMHTQDDIDEYAFSILMKAIEHLEDSECFNNAREKENSLIMGNIIKGAKSWVTHNFPKEKTLL